MSVSVHWFIYKIYQACCVRAYLTRAVGLPVWCANHYATRASRNELSNVGAIEVGFHSTQVPKSCRKWHRIHILVLSHSLLYMAQATLRWVGNLSSFPPMPLQIEFWAVSNLTFVLMSVIIQLSSTTEIRFKLLALYSLRSGTLYVFTAAPRVLYVGCAKMCLKHYMPLQILYITRNDCTQSNETNALGLPVVEWNTPQNM